MNASRIRLSRIIAFNWYGFRTIVDVDGLTLFCGETGTGKSALLDLIQFVLSAGAVKFNKAAAGESNARSIVGYCLGDTNTRNRSNGEPRYLRRSGATVIGLEFTWPPRGGDAPRRETWGMRIQFESPSAQPSYVRFHVPGRMERSAFCDDKGSFLTEEEFRSRVKHELDGDAAYASHTAFQEEMGVHRHLDFDEVQMRRTLPKAIAFELDTDYQTFIRGFILEPYPLDVINTRRSLSELRAAEKRVFELSEQQKHLEAIANENEQYQQAVREVLLRGHLRRALKHAEVEEKRAQAAARLATLRKDNKENAEKLKNASEAKAQAKAKLESIRRIASLDDPQFADYEQLVLERTSLEKEVGELGKKAKSAREYLTSLAVAWDNWLIDAENNNCSAIVDAGRLAALREPDIVAGLAAAAALVDDFNQIFNATLERQRSQASIIQGLEEKKARLDAYLKLLRADRTASTPLLDKLRSLGIRAQTLGRVIEVLPVGEEWWGTIEAILDRDSHAVVVDDSKDFAFALKQWIGMQKPEPLIDPGTLGSELPSPKSLATFCETSHPVARRFVDWRLGRLVAVEDRGELAATSHGAARDGAVREGPVSRQLTPVKELSLGEKGLRRLREAKQKEFNEIAVELSRLIRARDAVDRWLTSGKNAGLSRNDPPTSSDGIERLNELRPRVAALSDSVKVAETPDRAARLTQLRHFESTITASDQEIGRLKDPLSAFATEEQSALETLNSANRDVETSGIAIQQLRAKLPSGILEEELSCRLMEGVAAADSWRFRHDKAEAVEEEWKQKSAGAKGRRLKARNDLRSAYGAEYEEFDVEDESNEHYDRRLHEIRQNEVDKFQGQAKERRADWEKRLQEDVLDRLRQRLKEAKETINDFRVILNRPIGNYRYILRQVRDGTHTALWKLLDHTEDAQQPGDALFDHALNDEIEKAKSELMAAVENPDEKSTAALLDYRNYHYYDLEMVPVGYDDESEGNISLQARGRSLSGGEGQAPFFIAMLAAFYRVYDRGKGEKSTNLGLVVMDEAFSKLSAGHISDCLDLARNFGLQLILAFPMDRLGTMVQHADSIVQCRVKRTLDAKGAPIEIVNDVVRWSRDKAMEVFLQ